MASRKRTTKLLVLALLAAYALVMVPVLGCFHTQRDLTYVNATSSELTITHDGEVEVIMKPGDVDTGSTYKRFWPQTVEATDPEGNVVFRQRYTWEELEELNFRIVVTANPSESPTLAPTPP